MPPPNRFACNSCNGEYSETSRDGLTYFHVCAPLSGPELEAAGQPRRPDDAPPIERADKRDESPLVTFEISPRGHVVRKPAVPRLAGRGRRPLIA